jgi:hypothetical protein
MNTEHTNTHHLKGFRCKQCRSTGPFMLTLHRQVYLYDHGLVETEGNQNEWTDSTPCECVACHNHALVRGFRYGPLKREGA